MYILFSILASTQFKQDQTVKQQENLFPKIGFISKFTQQFQTFQSQLQLKKCTCYGLQQVYEQIHLQAKHPQLYQPIIKYNDQKWERLNNLVEINIPNTNEIDLTFEICFQQGQHTISIAFSYPYSYSECQEFLSSTINNYVDDEEIYVHKQFLNNKYMQREIFTKSFEERNIDIITISSNEGILKEYESALAPPLFPENKRAHKFRSNKPIIFLSARVHPGETPSSHVMNGVIKFLLNKYPIFVFESRIDQMKGLPYFDLFLSLYQSQCQIQMVFFVGIIEWMHAIKT